MNWITEFRKFAMRGNVIDLAVAVVIGGAFSKIVNSFVANIIMPPLNLLTARSGVNFNEAALTVTTDAPVLDAGKMVTEADGSIKLVPTEYAILNYGPFIQTIVDFLLIAVSIFLAIKAINALKDRFQKEEEVVAPSKPSEEVLLLREIRDSLKQN